MDQPLRARKPSIAGLMGVVLFSAFVLASYRGAFTGVPVYLYLMGGIVALALAQWFWFSFVPQRVIPWRTRGDFAAERRWLERVLAVPSVGNDAIKALPRFMLLVREQHDHRHAEAVALGRAILAHPKTLLPAFASLVHQRLADCLEGLGLRAEADAERALADDCLRGSQETYLGRQAQAKLYESENRYAEAYDTYHQGLALVPDHLTQVRAEFMSHLILTSFNAGRPADTLRWAEAVLALNTNPVFLQSARRMGAIALGNLGRLDEAERLCREAADLEPDTVKRAEILATAASFASRRGALAVAERAALDAEALSPRTSRMPWVVLAEIETIRGRYAESLAALERTRAVPPYPTPSAQRRIAAVIAKVEALNHAELGRSDTALALIRQSEAENGNDPKLGPEIDAAAARVCALAGNRDAALSRIASAEKRRRAVPGATETQRSVLGNLGRAAHALGLPTESETFWRGYLDLDPPPVYLPGAYYHLAECRRLLGDPDEALALYRRAASTNFGTLHERLARERLDASRQPGRVSG